MEENTQHFEIIQPGAGHYAGHPDDRNYYLFAIDGYIIPHITGQKVPVAEGEKYREWVLSLDDRFVSYAIEDKDLMLTLWFWSNAMAVASGWSCFGENSSLINHFGPGAHPLIKSHPRLQSVK